MGNGTETRSWSRAARLGAALAVIAAVVAAGCSVVGFPSPGRLITTSDPLTVSVPAHPAGTQDVPAAPITGEGVLRLAISGPGTTWVDAVNTSVVVEASVDGGPAQTFVLYGGASSYNYTGFTGPLTTGPHLVTVSIRADLSITTAAPTALLQNLELTVVPPTDPSYAAIAHAPVLYGRGVNAHSDTPLLAYATPSPLPGGGTRIEYTQIWSNEDAGTGIAPVLLWSGYGRTTDIETTVILDLDASGAVTGATYQTCSACGPDYPENQVGLDHSYTTFTGTYFAGHPIVRDATGNNVLKDAGTTAFRFQSALSPAPAPGAVREAAMDPYAMGYRVMGQEMRREQTGYSEDPLSTAAGDDRQYAIVDLDTTPVGTVAVGVQIKLTGNPTWYSNDYGTGGSFAYTGGHNRTAVKLPLDWHTRAIEGIRLVLYPTNPAPATPPTITVHSLRILEIGSDYSTSWRSSLPAPVVVTP